MSARELFHSNVIPVYRTSAAVPAVRMDAHTHSHTPRLWQVMFSAQMKNLVFEEKLIYFTKCHKTKQKKLKSISHQSTRGLCSCLNLWSGLKVLSSTLTEVFTTTRTFYPTWGHHYIIIHACCSDRHRRRDKPFDYMSRFQILKNKKFEIKLTLQNCSSSWFASVCRSFSQGFVTLFAFALLNSAPFLCCPSSIDLTASYCVMSSQHAGTHPLPPWINYTFQTCSSACQSPLAFVSDTAKVTLRAGVILGSP